LASRSIGIRTDRGSLENESGRFALLYLGVKTKSHQKGWLSKSGQKSKHYLDPAAESKIVHQQLADLQERLEQQEVTQQQVGILINKSVWEVAPGI